MIKPFQLYKHKNCTDVAMMPIKMYRIYSKNIVKIKCYWFNITNPDYVFNMGMTDKIEIKMQDLDKWLPYEAKT